MVSVDDLIQDNSLLAGFKSHAGCIMAHNNGKDSRNGKLNGAKTVGKSANDRKACNRGRMSAWHTSVTEKS